MGKSALFNSIRIYKSTENLIWYRRKEAIVWGRGKEVGQGNLNGGHLPGLQASVSVDAEVAVELGTGSEDGSEDLEMFRCC